MDTDKILSASFLLRLWQVEANGDLVWRVSLESAQTGERWGFPNLDALFDLLRRWTASTTTGAGSPVRITRNPCEETRETKRWG